jgi:hypothetical protein
MLMKINLLIAQHAFGILLIESDSFVEQSIEYADKAF